MKSRFLLCALVAASIGLIGPALAEQNASGFEMQGEKTIKLKSGKTVKVMMGMMHGKPMVVIPMEDLNEILMRSEGHDMSSTP
jgi:hypothetical protein